MHKNAPYFFHSILPWAWMVLFWAAPALGQEVQGTGGKKVGVVLSGGGAKGLAHIGALKVIEEAGVQVDYIGGSSMGAIVGALYAAGYSASELDSLFRALDFVNIIEDIQPRSAKTFYEKRSSERYALTLPFNKFKVSAPSAFSGGQNVYNELVRILYPVKDIRDFSKLPIPFICMATDVETGEEVLLDQGYLPEAIMASGTLPSLFEPVYMNGRVLIDGGVVNNYPVERVREMGADIIIGVDVQHGLADRDALDSATEILLQINNYRTVAQMVEKAAQTDIYIKPDIAAYSVLDFGQIDQIIQNGETAAREQLSELKRLATDKGVSKPSITAPKMQDSIIINRLILEGEDTDRGFVKGKLRFGLGQPVTFTKLNQGMANLAATNNFRTNRYKLTSNGMGNDLVMRLAESPTKSLLRLGVHYDDLYKSAALINYTTKGLAAKNDLISLDLVLGDNLRYNFQYFIDKGSYWSFGINSRYNDFTEELNYDIITGNFDVPALLNVNTINLDVVDLTNQMYVQTLLQEEFAFTLGVEHKFLKYSTRTLGDLETNPGDLTIDGTNGRTIFERSHYYSAFGQLVLDTYDDKFFPSKGLLFEGDFHYYLFSSDFNENFKDFSVSKARLGTAFPLAKRLSLNVETEGGFKLGTSSVTSFDFVLGGFGAALINNFIPFYGYDFLSLPGNSFVKAHARLDYEFAKDNHLLFAANYANVEDDIFRTGEWFTAPNFSGYAVGYGWESFIGPVQLMYSWSPEANNNNIFISVGFWF
ncbi:patatin-like phospholipase family protein [Maribacter sp. 2307ULW6-5]|uniref:patatin-like phospholipase family protein n=1 Tax=Maribacter sp. 2307ULW6-5 TaxID=3386275 RepID=UPI0039BD68B7